MTVAELIERLKTMRQDVPVSIFDNDTGTWSEFTGDVMFRPAGHGDRACVVLYPE